MTEGKKSVSSIAAALAEKFKATHKCSAWDINNGMCEEWAMDLIREIREQLGMTIGFEMGGLDLFDTAGSWPGQYSMDDFLQTKYGLWSKSALESYGFPPKVDINAVTHLPSHAWAVVDGRHYDAEATDGVDCWYELPIYQRFFDKLRIG